MISHTQEQAPKAGHSWFSIPPGDLLRIVWRDRLRVLLLTAGCTVIGLLAAFLLPPEFRSEARIMPEMNTSSGDLVTRLASVAGFAGMDLSEADGVDAVRPDLYPSVLQSTPFMLYLIDQPVATTDGCRLSVGDLLWSRERRWPSAEFAFVGEKEAVQRASLSKRSGPIRLSVRQQALAEAIGERVSARLDTRSGIITITAKMPDATAAALVAQLAMDYLTQYVTSYRTGKARQDLNFYRQRLQEARQRYQTAQLRVFQYNDQHKYIVMQAATMDKQRLEAELSIAQTVYTELARQFEQVRLKVQERTPVFKVLEPAQVPLKRASPKRTVVVLLSALIGLLVGTLYAMAHRMNVVEQLRIWFKTT